MACSQIMVQLSIHKVVMRLGLPQAGGMSDRESSLDNLPYTKYIQLCLGMSLSLMVGNPSTKTNSSIRATTKVPNDTVEVVQMPFVWGSTKASHCHDGTQYIKVPKSDGPLEGANEWLIQFNWTKVKELWVVSFWVVTLLKRGRVQLGFCSKRSCSLKWYVSHTYLRQLQECCPYYCK
jgi:hypothetical protein